MYGLKTDNYRQPDEKLTRSKGGGDWMERGADSGLTGNGAEVEVVSDDLLVVVVH